jgi:hypothetical protein
MKSVIRLETAIGIEHATYHAKSNQGPQLDSAVEVSKKDGNRKEYDIRGFSNEQANQFNDFGPGHEDELSDDRIVLAIAGQVFGSHESQIDDEGIEGKRQRRESGNVQGIC